LSKSKKGNEWKGKQRKGTLINNCCAFGTVLLLVQSVL